MLLVVDDRRMEQNLFDLLAENEDAAFAGIPRSARHGRWRLRYRCGGCNRTRSRRRLTLRSASRMKACSEIAT